MTTFSVIRPETEIKIDFEEYADFEDFVEEVLGQDTVTLSTFVEDLPCYFCHLSGTTYVKPDDIPIILEAACYYCGSESLLSFSVTSKEKNYKDWLEAVEGCPGVVIHEFQRDADHDWERTIYFVTIQT